MPAHTLLPRATLGSYAPYAVPEGARLACRFTHYTTDGFQRADVVVLFDDGSPPQVVATDVPVLGSTSAARALGDYRRIFPDPIPAIPENGSDA